MSEEILKALMQLFAIIAKQDMGATSVQRNFVGLFLKQQLSSNAVQEYIALYDGFAEISSDGTSVTQTTKRTSVRDSVKTLAICKKINKTLAQKQKVVVLFRLYELIKSDLQVTPQRLELIHTVATVFNIPSAEHQDIKNFVIDEKSAVSENILLLNAKEQEPGKHIFSEGLSGTLSIIKIQSVDLYFLKYEGKSEIYLNGLMFNSRNIHLFATGSTLRLPHGTVYYSDVVSRFLNIKDSLQISFQVNNLHYKFQGGKTGLRNIHISEESGKLVAFMGASGAGKTTLLNVLSGIINPTDGEALLNGINIHREKNKVKGIIGYIAQDDLLIEDLTVFQNLYYNAKLCFSALDEKQVAEKVNVTLENLGLSAIKELKVGNALNKKISGGQRKRLNIALELIREPDVLFVDEPTSGLSSRDSENVMDLLKELSLKGKLIFVVIHQPSSDIFKMFDKLLLLDVGGYPVYYGNPVEALIYFKQHTHQINADVGECLTCGNVNPELLFNIIEAKVVDEYGVFTRNRKTTPEEWHTIFSNQPFKQEPLPQYSNKTGHLFKPVMRIKQSMIFTTRDLLSKISNKQYLIINLLEAPLLAFILAFIVRYNAGNSSHYSFSGNENIPAYIFMSIIVALFIGLTVSAEEIFKDRKILKREKFLNLSRFSYLSSKTLLLFTLSAIQTMLFVVLGNFIIGIKGMTLDYWFMLFTVSCFANMLGLNISASFNSAVTIYILIPVLIIPQMILGGALFEFDKLNNLIGGGNRVPLIAEVITARWAYEGLVVNQFANSEYGKLFYDISRNESYCNFKLMYYIPKLEEKLSDVENYLIAPVSGSLKDKATYALLLLNNEISKETVQNKSVDFCCIDKINISAIDEKSANETNAYIERLRDFYATAFNAIHDKKNKMVSAMWDTSSAISYKMLYDDFFNEALNDIVRKNLEKNKIVEQEHRLVQIIDPIFTAPGKALRSHFFAAKKFFAGTYISAFLFNAAVIWLMSIVLFVTLYYNILYKIINFFTFAKEE